ncbi:MAG TPA: carboxypeptidase-like regulatory domain-containing protein, partial [Mucilaginibacter sp.]|nr:carboxypeptidase-like regulatory domain-containing protein [Mucilaginibacter sp.]
MLLSFSCFAQHTAVSGHIVDAGTGLPLPAVSVIFAGSTSGTITDSLGRFTLSAPGSYVRILVSAVGYQPLARAIQPNVQNEVQLKLEKSQTQLNEVAIKARSRKRYRNKNNPAVE